MHKGLLKIYFYNYGGIFSIFSQNKNKLIKINSKILIKILLLKNVLTKNVYFILINSLRRKYGYIIYFIFDLLI